jgi:hypothetical protein
METEEGAEFIKSLLSWKLVWGRIATFSRIQRGCRAGAEARNRSLPHASTPACQSVLVIYKDSEAHIGHLKKI